MSEMSSCELIPGAGTVPYVCLEYPRTLLPVASDRLAIAASSGRAASGRSSKTANNLCQTARERGLRASSWKREVHHSTIPCLQASVVPPALDTATETTGLAASRSETSSRARITWAALNPTEIGRAHV